MGEAKRRQQAGAYPRQGEALDAARRFWCGRDPVPVGDFRAPKGTIAITFDVAGTSPTSCMIESASLQPMLLKLEEQAKQHSYYFLVRMVAHEFTRARREGDDAAFNWLAMVGLWTAFNHPQTGGQMREAVSEHMRQDKTPHITWCFGPGGLAIALAERFVDVEGLTALAPKNTVVSYVTPSDPVVQS